MALSEKHVTPDLGIMRSSPTMGIEILFIYLLEESSEEEIYKDKKLH